MKKHALLLSLILLGLITRLYWTVDTNFTEEDAFITFRIAKNLADGVGMIYNIGERVLGTTSPLFAILLSGWILAISENVVLGATIFNLLTSVSSLILLGLTMRKSGTSKGQQITILVIFALSAKLIFLEIGGMETSLGIFLMLASWYTYVSRRMILTGVILGLLMLTRIDLFVWPFTILLFELIQNPKRALQVGLIAFLMNLPWIIFSLNYFGSPIPHTVNAKWAAYIQHDNTSYTTHLKIVANYLSPFSQYENHILLRNILAWMTLLIVFWQSFKEVNKKNFNLLSVFILLELSRLVFTRATFFNRYFALLLVAVLIQFGMGIGNLWQSVRSSAAWIKLGLYVALIAMIGMGLLFSANEANQRKLWQTYRYEFSLKKVGQWLHQNTPSSASVLLEPLGYVGYYSERYMIDEVGLVSPEVVALKQEMIPSHEYFLIFQPDYFVLHCDDAIRLQGTDEYGESVHLVERYTRRVTFNPLKYDMHQPDYSVHGALQRRSCYDIWERNRQAE